MLFLQEIMGSYETGGGGAKLGCCAPRFGPKTATAHWLKRSLISYNKNNIYKGYNLKNLLQLIILQCSFSVQNIQLNAKRLGHPRILANSTELFFPTRLC